MHIGHNRGSSQGCRVESRRAFKERRRREASKGRFEGERRGGIGEGRRCGASVAEPPFFPFFLLCVYVSHLSPVFSLFFLCVCFVSPFCFFLFSLGGPSGGWSSGTAGPAGGGRAGLTGGGLAEEEGRGREERSQISAFVWPSPLLGSSVESWYHPKCAFGFLLGHLV